MDRQILDTLISIKNVLERSSRTTASQSPHAQNEHQRTSARATRAPAPSQKTQAKQDINFKGVATGLEALSGGSRFAAKSTRLLGRRANDASGFVEALGSTASLSVGLIGSAHSQISAGLRTTAASLDTAISVTVASVIAASTKLTSVSASDFQTKINDTTRMLEALSIAGSNTKSFDTIQNSFSSIIGHANQTATSIVELGTSSVDAKGALAELPNVVTRIQAIVGALESSVSTSAGKMRLASRMFTKSLGGTIGTVITLNKMLGESKTVLDAINNGTPPPPAPPSQDSGKRENRQNNKSNSPSFFDDFINHLKQNTVSFQASVNRTMIRQVSMIGQHLKSLGDDVFTSLMPRGIDITSFGALSLDALKAGMSLREYTKMLEDSSGVVSRVGGFDNFNKVLTQSNKQLAHLGVFGEDATRLSQSIAATSQAMGIPVDQIGNAVAGQVKVFDKLRKTTNMSAASFEDLRRTVVDSEITQSELLALAPSERAARQTELMELASWGAALGMSKQQTSQLAQAMLELRKSTVKQRSEDAMYLTQAFAMVGMTASQAAEAAAIKRKSKPSAEEEKRLGELMGLYKQKAEQITGSNDTGLMGLQIGIENVQEKFSGSLQKLMDAGGQVIAAKESGAQTENNKTGENKQGEFFSPIFTTIEGFLKNDLARAAAAGLMMVASVAYSRLQLKVLERIEKKIGGGGGDDKSVDGEKDKKGSKKEKGPTWKRKLSIAARRVSRSASTFADSAMNTGRAVADKMKNPASTAKSVIGAIKGFSPSAFFKSAGEVGKNVLGKGLSVVKSGFQWLGKIAGPVMNKLPLIGGLLTAGLATFDYSNAEEQAKEKGISTEERKGEIIGGAAGGLALGAVGAMFGGPIGAVVGGVVGEWLGSKAGGIIGANFTQCFGPSSWIGKAIAGVSAFLSSASAMVSSAASKVTELSATIGNAVSTWASSVAGVVGGWLESAQNTISSKFEEWFGKDTKMGAVIAGVSSIATSIATAASDIFANFASWFGKDSTLGRVVKGAAGIAAAAADATVSAASAVVGGAKSVFKSNTDATIKNTSAVARTAVVAGNDLGSLASDVRSTAQAYAKPLPADAKAKPEVVPAKPTGTTPDGTKSNTATQALANATPTNQVTPVSQAAPTPQIIQPVQKSVLASPVTPMAKSVNQQAVNTTSPPPLADATKAQDQKEQADKVSSGTDITSLKDGLQLIADLLKKANETELAQLEALLAMIRSSGKSLALLNNQDLTKMLNA